MRSRLCWLCMRRCRRRSEPMWIRRTRSLTMFFSFSTHSGGTGSHGIHAHDPNREASSRVAGCTGRSRRSHPSHPSRDHGSPLSRSTITGCTVCYTACDSISFGMASRSRRKSVLNRRGRGHRARHPNELTSKGTSLHRGRIPSLQASSTHFVFQDPTRRHDDFGHRVSSGTKTRMT